MIARPGRVLLNPVDFRLFASKMQAKIEAVDGYEQITAVGDNGPMIVISDPDVRPLPDKFERICAAISGR
jgi:hypothetical protein